MRSVHQSLKGEIKVTEEIKALPKGSLVAVIGAGTMGAGIAQVAALSGYQVKLYDAFEGAAEKGANSAKGFISRMIEKERVSKERGEEAIAALKTVESLDDLHDADLVIEAIVEDLSVKQELFKSLETITRQETIFATNTSSISVTAIGSALNYPERLAGMHFFNPAPLMKLVEIVSGLASDQAVLQQLYETAKVMGKVPVHTRSTPGFIVNRVARPFYAESLRVVEENGATPATIDAAIRGAGGFRMGPFELMDLIGHDVNYSVTESVWRAYYYDQRFLPSLIQKELVDANFLGRKSGRGFYQYGEDAENPTPDIAPDRSLNGEEVTLYLESLRNLKGFEARFKEKGLPYNYEEEAQQDERLLQVGEALLYLANGASATQMAYSCGEENVVSIDLALDYQKADHIAISRAEQCSDSALNSVIALLQALDFKVSVIKDTPGLLVMRTVAMLANEAADAVNQNVGSVEAVDTAMTLGVNYPKGPLAWADEVGIDHIGRTLLNLHQSYGEDRYRLSPLLAQKLFAEGAFYE